MQYFSVIVVRFAQFVVVVSVCVWCQIQQRWTANLTGFSLPSKCCIVPFTVTQYCSSSWSALLLLLVKKKAMNFELFCLSLFLVFTLGTHNMLGFVTGLECELLLQVLWEYNNGLILIKVLSVLQVNQRKRRIFGQRVTCKCRMCELKCVI